MVEDPSLVTEAWKDLLEALEGKYKDLATSLVGNIESVDVPTLLSLLQQKIPQSEASGATSTEHTPATSPLQENLQVESIIIQKSHVIRILLLLLLLYRHYR